jgi:hypothetical protein
MARRESLEEITSKIKRSIFESNITSETRDNYREFYRRLSDKIEPINELLSLKYLFPKPGDEDYGNLLFEFDILDPIFRRSVELKLDHGDKEGILYVNGEIIPCLREEDKLIFSNPAVEDGRSRVQSWGNVDPIGRSYGKHTSVSKNRNASKFRKGLDIEGVELRVFNEGRGYLDSNDPENRLFLFKEFCEEIGSDRERIVKLHVDRVHRNKGYRTKVHGYPVSTSEAERDFPEGFRK